MSADRFRLAIFVLIVVVLAAAAWAFQWRYVVVAAGEVGTLMRFNRLTGAEQLYICDNYGTVSLYGQPRLHCGWVERFSRPR